MNSDGLFGELFGLTFTAIVLGICVVLAATLTPFIVIFGFLYAGIAIYMRSPMHKERHARHLTDHVHKVAKSNHKSPSEEYVERFIIDRLPSRLSHDVRNELVVLAEMMYEREIVTEVPPPPPIANSLEGARYRDRMAKAAAQGVSHEMHNIVLEAVSESMAEFARSIPQMDGDLHVPCSFLIADIQETVLRVINPIFADDIVDNNLLEPLRKQLIRNIENAPNAPNDWKERDGDMVELYLRGTPLAAMFDIEVPFSLSEKARSEHHFIIGGTGHGKTVSIENLIAKDIEKVRRGDASVIVIDSQGDLINKIRYLDGLDESNTVIVDPTDLEYPTALNLFDVNLERFASYGPLAVERQLNGVIELYDYILDDRLADHVMMEMYRNGIINLQRIATVNDQWNEPMHEEWGNRTAWRMFNAATYALSGRVSENPGTTAHLHQIIDGAIAA